MDYFSLAYAVVSSVSSAGFAYYLYRSRKAEKEKAEAQAKLDIAERQAKYAVHDARQIVEKETAGAVEQEVANLRKRFEPCQLEAVADEHVNEVHTAVMDHCKKLSIKHAKKAAQDVVAEVDAAATKTVEDIQATLVERLWADVQQFRDPNEEDTTPPLLGEGVKLAYTRGDRTVLVVEQKPQTRTVRMAASVVPTQQRPAAVSMDGDFYRFSLAFPYVYFVVVFDKGKYAFHQVFFRNKSLTTTREHVYGAPLPNISPHPAKKHRSCVGNPEVERRIRNEGPIGKQCDRVINEFWLRAFNAELGTGNAEAVDPRLSGWHKWQHNSKLNPFFVLDVKWKDGSPLKVHLDRIMDQRPTKTGETNSEQKLRTTMQKAGQEISQVVSKSLREGIKKIETLEVKDQELSMLMDKLLKTYGTKAFEALKESNVENAQQKRLRDSAMEKLKAALLQSGSADEKTIDADLEKLSSMMKGDLASHMAEFMIGKIDDKLSA